MAWPELVDPEGVSCAVEAMGTPPDESLMLAMIIVATLLVWVC